MPKPGSSSRRWKIRSEMTDGAQHGDVWNYPYLRARQARKGESGGRKSRPCVLAVTIGKAEGRTWVVLLAVTTQPPAPDAHALEVPETEKRRAGLDTGRPMWVILDEHNRDIVETSFYFEPQGKIGRIGAPFLKQVQAEFIKALRERRSLAVGRADV